MAAAATAATCRDWLPSPLKPPKRGPSREQLILISPARPNARPQALLKGSHGRSPLSSRCQSRQVDTKHTTTQHRARTLARPACAYTKPAPSSHMMAPRAPL